MRAFPTIRPDRPNLLDLSEEDLGSFVRKQDWPAYRARQILKWLYQKRVRSFSAMSDLSQADRQWLAGRACLIRTEECRILGSQDGSRKFLMRLADGLDVESVLIPESGRLTLCLSTQVGCTLDCGFCLTGQLGLVRNLRAYEITDQVLTVQDHLATAERLTNLVLMGMGEPLANIEAVTQAVTALTNPQWGVGIPGARITLSTAGLAARLEPVAALGINLAISLNATTDEQRARLMPAASRLHSISELLDACRRYPLPPRRRLTFEYVLLAGENDSDQDARRLAGLVRGIRCKINLIPFNEFPQSPYRRPDEAVVLGFQSLLKQKGLDVFIRHSKGRDVLGACGQLGRDGPRTPIATLTPVETRC